MDTSIVYNTKYFYFDIVFWTILSIALMRILEFIDINFYILYFLLPGIIFSFFLIYYMIKTKTFIRFWKFMLCILLISLGYHIITLLIIKFVQIQYIEDYSLRILIMILTGIIVSSIFYTLSFVIKKVVNLCRGQ